MVTHHIDPERLLAWAKGEGRIAVGWNGVGDLRDFGSEEEIKRAVRETGNPNWPVSGRQLLAFRDEMKPGDLVILSAGGARRAVMRIDGDYEFLGPQDDDRIYSHQRRWTLVRCASEVNVVNGQVAPAEA